MPRRKKLVAAPRPKAVPDLRECDSCGFETMELTAYPRLPLDGIITRGPSWLCDLCAGTMAGMAEEDPRNFPGQDAMLKTICYVGNAILAELRKGKG